MRNRDRRRQAAAELAELDGEEAAALEAQLGVAPRELPPHLRGYALRRRSAACFSGPGLLPVEQEVGHVEYKLRLLDPTPSRFQQLVRAAAWGGVGRGQDGGGRSMPPSPAWRRGSGVAASPAQQLEALHWLPWRAPPMWGHPRCRPGLLPPALPPDAGYAAQLAAVRGVGGVPVCAGCGGQRASTGVRRC